MRFKWDAQGRVESQKHRVSFDEAVTVFYDSLAATFVRGDWIGPNPNKAERTWT
jgi:uncharacterized DUF497 family protein